MEMEAAVHKRNLESSILFMQQDHATTLKALHDEIQKLQKKCTGKINAVTLFSFFFLDCIFLIVIKLMMNGSELIKLSTLFVVEATDKSRTFQLINHLTYIMPVFFL
jgi:hypothetical protein